MRMCFNTDGLGSYGLDEMLGIAGRLGFESLEFACGNWSTAPHVNLDDLLSSSASRQTFVDAVHRHGLTIEALNCSGNQLAPNDEGKAHQEVVEKTFRLAEMLGIDVIVMMSGCPGGSPSDTTPNWICTSWPPITARILEWQWNEVALPYWEKTVAEARRRGIRKIALENHGCQLVYNAETLFRLRDHVGDLMGMNLDPSHLMWMGGDPIAAARTLGDAIYYVHAKDVRHERSLCDANGVLDTKTIDKFAGRSWNYVALGYGHDLRWWKEFFSVLGMVGYDGPVSLEMEDLTMDALTGVTKSASLLKEALPRLFSAKKLQP